MGDCDVDGPGGYCNGDRQDGTRITEDCGGTSGVGFRLILEIENDWAAVDKVLCAIREVQDTIL